MREVQVRSLVASKDAIAARLLAEGFAQAPPVELLDLIFDRPDASLFKSGHKIRLRVEPGIAVLTYKSPFQGSSSASRREALNIRVHEGQVGEVSGFLAALGYPYCFSIPKTRWLYSRGAMTATFDDWPLIGLLFEISGPEDQCVELSHRVAPDNDFSNLRLSELLRSKAAEEGLSVLQLKRRFEAERGFSLGRIELLCGEGQEDDV